MCDSSFVAHVYYFAPPALCSLQGEIRKEWKGSFAVSEVSGCCVSVHNTLHLIFEGYVRFVYICSLAVLWSDNSKCHGKD